MSTWFTKDDFLKTASIRMPHVDHLTQGLAERNSWRRPDYAGTHPYGSKPAEIKSSVKLNANGYNSHLRKLARRDFDVLIKSIKRVGRCPPKAVCQSRPQDWIPFYMNVFFETTPPRHERAALLSLIVVLHVGALWALTSGAVTTSTSAPAKVVSAFMVQAAPAAPVVTETKPVTPQAAPQPPKPKPTPKPKPRVEPKPQPVKPAITTPPQEPVVEAPAVAAAPSTAPLAVSAAAQPSEGASTGPAPVTASPPPAQPKMITSGVEYITMPSPKYPPQSRRIGEEGKVVLRVLINDRGRSERIDIQHSSGSSRLDQAAREAVQMARFKPYIEDGRAIAVFAIIPIAFKLEN